MMFRKSYERRDAVQFSIVTTQEALFSLQHEWQSLLDNSDANAVFSSPELAQIFWTVFGEGASLRLVCVRQDDQLVALFPFYVRRQNLLKLFTLDVLHLLGTGGDTSPDYLGGIVHRDVSAQHQALFSQALGLLQREWDLCDIRDMTVKPDLTRLRQACDGGLLHASESSRPIILAVLADNWDAYLSKLSSNRRQQIRRARRKIFDQGIELDRLENLDQLDDWFDSLVRLHHKRWKQKGEGEHGFNTERYNNFHRALMSTMLERGVLRLWGLRREGELIAVLYCLTDGDSTYYYQGGFDTDYDQLKPGMVLMSCAMEEAIKEGCKNFNMMKGDYDFKRSLAKEEDRTFSAVLVRPTLSGAVYTLRFVLLPRIKAMLKRSGK